MKTEILEKRCAEALLGYSQTMADAYTTEPEETTYCGCLQTSAPQEKNHS